MNQTHTISFRDAKAEIVHAIRETNDDVSVVEWEDKVGVLLSKNLEEPVEQILFDLVDQQDLSQQHKKEMYDSFEYKVTTQGIDLVFNPKTPLMGALENGAPPRSLEDSVLSRNYKVSKEGHRYRVIPLRSKDAARNADKLTPKQIITNHDAEDQFFREISILNGETEKTLTFQESLVTDRERHVRSSAFVTKVDGRRKSSRIYVAAPRGQTVNNVSRFIIFRTITDNPAKQWRPIPGFPGLKLADELVKQYTELIKDETQRLIGKLS